MKMRNFLKIFLFFLLIPLGCTPYNSENVIRNFSNQDMLDYKIFQNVIDKIEINKSILTNLFGIYDIEFKNIKRHPQISTFQILSAYNQQLLNIINAMKSISIKTRKNYFSDLKLSVEISKTTKNEVSLNLKEKSLKILMSSHINSESIEKTYLETIDEYRLQLFFAKNLKSFQN